MTPPFGKTGKHPRPQVGNARPPGGHQHGGHRSCPRASGSAVQKQEQWLARADAASRAGDAVEAERCRQYAEHWYRMSRGQE